MDRGKGVFVPCRLARRGEGGVRDEGEDKGSGELGLVLHVCMEEWQVFGFFTC